MPIPELNEYGFIPVGTHNVTLEELQTKFCYNQIRQDNWNQLKEFLQFIYGMNCFAAVEFFGSYFTDKDAPGDIDVVLEFKQEDHTDTLNMDIFDKPLLRERYNVDVTLKEPDNIVYKELLADNYVFTSKHLATFRTLKKEESQMIYERTGELPGFGVSYKGILRFEI